MTPEDSGGPRSDRAGGVARERRAGRALLALILVFYAYVIPRGPDHNPDSRHALTYSLVERRSLVVDELIGATLDRAVRDGHGYSEKAPGVSLLLAPLYVLVRQLPLAEPEGERFATRYLLTLFGIGAPAACFAVWLFHWLRRFTPRVLPRWIAVIGLSVGSPAYAYSVHAFGHVPAAVCLFLGTALLHAHPRRPAPGGALMGLAVAFEYTALAPAALLIAWLAARRRRDERTRSVALTLAGAAPPLLALAAYHTVAFGAPWRTGYAFVDPAGPYAAAQASGVLGIGWPDPGIAVELLVGQKRGLLTLAPWTALVAAGAVVGWRRGEAVREWVVAAALAFLPLLAINAGYAVWDGGASWGPRHLTPALPFLVVVAHPAIVRWPRTGASLVLCSVAVTTVGVLTGTLPPADVSSTLGEFVLPALESETVGNTLGGALGLRGWWTLAPLAVALSAAYAATRRRPANSPSVTSGQISRAALGQRV
ncbi:MAG TPA: hypothetical protein VFX49_09660 [Chloroflexota bacterium]|nr:hypothetical protein [Chloroflexota bacterium]